MKSEARPIHHPNLQMREEEWFNGRAMELYMYVSSRVQLDADEVLLQCRNLI
jgi:hypothetical protein